MYRRRRPPRREVAFSFDSFLDLVANVIGIIIRLILVAWVGARTYQSTMAPTTDDPPSQVAEEPKLPEDPLERELLQTQKDLELARAELYDKLKQLDVSKDDNDKTSRELSLLDADRENMDKQGQALDQTLAAKGRVLPQADLTMAELRQRSQEVIDQIQALKKLPTMKKILRYRTPVSKPVHTDEFMFECHNGRVTFIDLPAFMTEIKRSVQEKIDRMASSALSSPLGDRSTGDADGIVGPIGAYRMHYGLERHDSLSGYSYGLEGWVLEAVVPVRGETLQQALGGGSEFRLITDAGVPGQTVVTFWVYPDSFGLFRELRDFLYERGLEVAGRPISEGTPMAASRHGTKSRGQ
jgi:hypothetical protein